VIKTLQVSADTASPPWYIGITPNGKYAYVSLDDGTLAIIDNADSRDPVVAPRSLKVATDADISGITMTPNGQYAYIAEDADPGGVIVIVAGVQTDKPRVFKRLKIDAYVADQVAVTPDGKYAYVADSTDHVLVINGPETKDPAVSRSTLPVEVVADQVAVQPDGDYASAMTCTSDFCDGIAEIAGASTPHPKSSDSWSPGAGLQAMAFVNLDVAGLGDSYSAGNGTPDADGPCEHSPQAWPHLIGASTLLVCSGASSNGAETSPKQDLPVQISELRKLSPEAGFVTITIGGDDGKPDPDDAGFFNVLVACAKSRVRQAPCDAAEKREDACLVFSEAAVKSINNMTKALDDAIQKAVATVRGVQFVLPAETAFNVNPAGQQEIASIVANYIGAHF
jgi:hypothetical protein